MRRHCSGVRERTDVLYDEWSEEALEVLSDRLETTDEGDRDSRAEKKASGGRKKLAPRGGGFSDGLGVCLVGTEK